MTYTTLPRMPEIYRYATSGERAVAEGITKLILSRGYSIKVICDADDDSPGLVPSRDMQAIIESLAWASQDALEVYDGDRYLGAILLVWGNDPSGDELIADYSVKLEEQFPELAESDPAPKGWGT